MKPTVCNIYLYIYRGYKSVINFICAPPPQALNFFKHSPWKECPRKVLSISKCPERFFEFSEKHSNECNSFPPLAFGLHTFVYKKRRSGPSTKSFLAFGDLVKIEQQAKENMVL